MAIISKTISQAANGPPDFDNIQEAFDAAIDDGNDYVFTILDQATYSERPVLAVRSSGLVTLQAGTFGRDSRPVIADPDNADGGLLTLKAPHVVKGIKFDFQSDTLGIADRYCIDVPVSVTKSHVSHCELFMGGRYMFVPAGTDFGHIGYRSRWDTDDIQIWNNLFRRCGYIGAYVDPAPGDVVKVFNNTFIKSQEGIGVETMSAATTSIWNNIFDMDPDFAIDCDEFYDTWINDVAPPADFVIWDYNLHYFRNFHLQNARFVYRGNTPNRWVDLSDFQTANPGVADNSLLGDPRFCVYCGDYHLQADSPALGVGLAAGAPTDDHDGLVRPAAPSMGCYEMSQIPCGGRILGPQVDDKQNATMWGRLTRVRKKSDVAGVTNNVNINLGGARID